MKAADKVARNRTAGTLTAYVVRRLEANGVTIAGVTAEWTAVASLLSVAEVQAVLASTEYEALIERVRQRGIEEVQEGVRRLRLAAQEAAEHAEWVRREAAQRAEQQRAEQQERAAARRRSDPDSPYKTLKQAKADGWHDARAEEYGGERLLLRGHNLARNAKVAQSRTAWRTAGYVVKADEKPHATLRGRKSSWDVFRDDQVEYVNQDLIDMLDRSEQENDS